MGKEVEALRARPLSKGDPSCAPAGVALGVLRTPAHRGNPSTACRRFSNRQRERWDAGVTERGTRHKDGTVFVADKDRIPVGLSAAKFTSMAVWAVKDPEGEYLKPNAQFGISSAQLFIDGSPR